jgi:predicted NUDIX family phosphoesterase
MLGGAAGNRHLHRDGFPPLCAMSTNSEPKEEEVLVVPRAMLEELGMFQGITQDVDRYLARLLDPANNFFMRRSLAEDDPSHKQIIPYAIFHHKGRFLCYTRGKGGGEKRLASKSSIGIGGHINQEDAGVEHLGLETYLRGVEREFAEELKIAGTYRQSIAALLNDDSTPVGSVHLGIIHVVDLSTDDVQPAEEGISDLRFLTPAELLEMKPLMEGWSVHCLEQLEGLTAKLA